MFKNTYTAAIKVSQERVFKRQRSTHWWIDLTWWITTIKQPLIALSL